MSRWARVFASVMSLTATISMSLLAWAALRTRRPMRPKPLMATLMPPLWPHGYKCLSASQHGDDTLPLGDAVGVHEACVHLEDIAHLALRVIMIAGVCYAGLRIAHNLPDAPVLADEHEVERDEGVLHPEGW